MQLIPAIDLKGGRCVRLFQGKKDRETKYSDDPVGMALRWQKQGAQRLHIVDLDGAFAEDSVNLSIVRKIIKKVSIPCQVGGGLRSTRVVESLLEAGCDGAIIGTAGVRQPQWLEKLVEQFGGDSIIAGVDCELGEVMVEGWEEGSALSRAAWLENLESLGVEKIIYTDVGRDGTENGPDIKGVAEILSTTKLKVIASGGVGELEHLESLATIENSRLIGVIVGRALYENNFTISEARKVLNKNG
ncbi:MAG: 1-(5-phosphoribosyl)-5-[(5-phosphoribosylamino)methylideneamino]imidazole-4-carboxamide isomerase [bacterium]